ncbi:hypothetical protein V1512DRAFT_264254 [Lipomyces arxii]|uniref:uncharacterized protein n=1 Tax=Lipomyces arxii TaxID=56418 RepID=UPI0034CD3526
MAHLSEYQGAIALLDLDRSGSTPSATPATTTGHQSPPLHQQPLPRIVMPEDEVQNGAGRRASRNRHRTSIADLLSDSGDQQQQQQQQQHLQPPHVYTNSANPPIDTQLLSPMSHGNSPPSTATAQAAVAFSNAQAGGGSYAYSPSPVSPNMSQQLPSLPSVMQQDNTYRHHVTDPALSGIIPANPVRTGANANAEYHQASAPTSGSSNHSMVKREKAAANHPSSPNASSGQTPSVSRPYKCPHNGCKWTFARHSDQRRHLRSHYSPNFHCPYWRTDPTCHRNGGAFNRLDVLKRHLRLVHFVQLKDTDAGWCRLCQKMFASPRVFVEHCEKCAESVQPTEWKKSTGEGDSMPSEHA